MTRRPVSLRLTGATILRDGELQQRSVAIENGRISKGPLPEVNLKGYLVLPGIIDLHGDAFERHLQTPAPGRPDLTRALRATDLDAAANGVTTAWMAHSWSWEGGYRGPDHAERFLAALERYRPEALTDLQVQIRCETHAVNTTERLLAAIRRFDISYVVFTNRLGTALDLSISQPDLVDAWALRAGRAPQDYHADLHVAARNKQDVPRFLCRLAEAFDSLGVSYGSHDDPDGETREFYSMIGAKICEFPIRRSAAALARAVGNPILMGAPNILRGGSHAGNVSATELLRGRLCDALVSDDTYAALPHAAFHLVDKGWMSLPAAWALISARPAQILRMPDRGVIDYGKRADLVVINRQTRAIEATLSGGRIAHLSGQAATRFLGACSNLTLAAE